MRFLADENFPRAAVEALRADGNDVLWIAASSPGLADVEILALAAQQGRVILTFDKDFGELARGSTLPASCGIVLFRLPMPAPGSAGAYLKGLIVSRSDWAGQFSVVEPHRIRMRPLPLL